MSNRINPYMMFVGSFLPNWLLRRHEVSLGAKVTYARLAQYAGSNGVAFPKIETLGDELGVSGRMVQNYLGELERFGLIERDRPGMGQPNRYYFLRHEWMEPSISDQDRKDISDPEWKDSSTQEQKDSSTPTIKRISRRESVQDTSKRAISPELQQAIDTWTTEGLGKLSMKATSGIKVLIATYGLPLVVRGIQTASRQSIKWPVSWMESTLPAWKREDEANGSQGSGRAFGRVNPQTPGRPGNNARGLLGGITQAEADARLAKYQ